MSQTIDKLPKPQGMPDWQWIDLRVQLMLLEAGYKKAMSVHIRSDVPKAMDSLGQLSKLLANQGLYCRLYSEVIHSSYHLYVGKNKEFVDDLERSLSGRLPIEEADLIHGRLSGFPETAIQAFLEKNVIKSNGLPDEVRRLPEYIFGTFKFSKEHWHEELEVSREWANYIKQHAPELYEQFLAQFTEMRAQ